MAGAPSRKRKSCPAKVTRAQSSSRSVETGSMPDRVAAGSTACPRSVRTGTTASPRIVAMMMLAGAVGAEGEPGGTSVVSDAAEVI